MLTALKRLIRILTMLITLWIGLHWWLRPRQNSPFIIGHRGARGLAPENTLAAIRAGLASGATHVEIDIQRSADGQIVLFHDMLVDGITDGMGAVAALSWDELQSLDVGSHVSPAFAGERIPALSELLALLQDTAVTLVVEVKYSDMFPGLEQELATMLEQFTMAHRVVVISFDIEWLSTFRKVAPHVQTAEIWFASPFMPLYPATTIIDIDWPTILLDPTFIWRMRRQQKEVWVYTVNHPALMRLMMWLGATGITTDRPDVGVALKSY